MNSVLEREPNLPILTSILSNIIYFDDSILQLSKAIKTMKSYQNYESYQNYQNYEKAIKTMKKLSKI